MHRSVDVGGKMMDKRNILAVLFGVGTALLSWLTIAENLSPRNPWLVALVVGVLAAIPAFIKKQPHPVACAVLIVCGTLCLLGAIGLQFYVAGIMADFQIRGGQEIMRALRESSQTQPSANFKLNANLPNSITEISYITMIIGGWLASFGAWGAVPRSKSMQPEFEATMAAAPSGGFN